MADLIDRQAAIMAVMCGALSSATIYGRSDEGMVALRETIRAIKGLPSAQPERKTGEWIIRDSDDDKFTDIRCSSCKHPFTVDSYDWCDIGFTIDDLKFCPNCGAKMEVEHADN